MIKVRSWDVAAVSYTHLDVYKRQAIPGVLGALVILGDKLAVKGQIKLAPMST